MRVKLIKSLQGKGERGDVIEVAAGFANNYLFPKGIAVRATEKDRRPSTSKTTRQEKSAHGLGTAINCKGLDGIDATAGINSGSYASTCSIEQDEACWYQRAWKTRKTESIQKANFPSS